MRVALERDDEREAERDDLRQTKGQQGRPRGTRSPFMQPGRKQQAHGERPTGALDLEVERLRRIEVHANALPVPAPFQHLTVRSCEPVASLQAGACADRVCLQLADDHMARLE